MSAALLEAANAQERFRVLTTAPGVDQAAVAVDVFRGLRRRLPSTQITTRGVVLGNRLRSLLPFESRKWACVRFNQFTRNLWKAVTGTTPELIDGYSVDLLELRELLRSDYVRPQTSTSLIVVQGQQLPADFYTLLRLLGVATTVLVDPHQMVDETGSTLPEILDCFGLSGVVRLPPGSRTKAGAVLADNLGTRRLSATQREVSAVDDNAVLAGHRSVEDEADFVAELAYEDPDSQIGLLLPTADLVEAFVDMLRNRFDGTIQWYLSRLPSPPEAAVDGTTPGIKVLTWTSGAGLRFDHVVLGSLDRVTNEGQFESALRTLGCSARDRLLLSYTGQGEPTMLARLPRQLLQLRTPPRTSDPIDAPQIQAVAAAAPATPPAPVLSLPTRAGPDDVAREVINADLQDLEHRRRVLTAQEEVGLALLMRAGEYALNEELPHGFRSTLAPKDQRARAFDAFISHNEGLVQSYISRHRGGGLDDEDIQQHGVIGLMRAVEKFDASRGLKFSTYATHWINQAMSRAIPCEGTLIRLPVHVHEVVRKVLATRRTLDRLNIAPTVAEIARRAEMSPADVVKHLQLAAGTVSLDAPLASGDDLCLADLVAVESDDASPDNVFERQDGQALVHKALALMKPRDAEVLRYRFGFHSDDDLTLEQVGAQFGVTRERIRQIEGRAKQSLRGKLAQVGLVSTESESEALASGPTVPARRIRVRTSQPPASPLLVQRHELASGTHLEDKLGTRSGSSITELVTEFIDQAVRAGANKVSVRSEGAGATAFLTFTHNGSAFTNRRLHEIFLKRGGSSSPRGDILTATAMTLYDELITWEAEASTSHHTCLVLTSGRDTGSWWVGQGLGTPPSSATGPERNNAVVALRTPRPQIARMPLREVLVRLEDQLSLVFGELLDGGLCVTVDSRKLVSRDPFLWANPAAQHLGEEILTAGDHSVKVSPRVLPHPSLLRPDDQLSAGEPGTWAARQGFYLRCEGRLLSRGGWLGLCTPTSDSHLARVLVEVAAEDRAVWGLSDPSGEISVPDVLRPRLAALASLAMQRSKLVVDSHRTESAQ